MSKKLIILVGLEMHINASKKAGYTNKEADLAYSTVDLATSVYGLTKNVVKTVPYANVPNAKQFKLFNALASDYQKAWRTMSSYLLGEGYGNFNTIKGMVDHIMTDFFIYVLSSAFFL
ncbi:DUF4225 domain-containing protein [Aliivibrio fischeri]